LYLITTELLSRDCGYNLAFENLFLNEKKDENNGYLVFYENMPALVLGKSLDVNQEIWLHKQHPKVYRRISGGGSVIHLMGNLNYALYLSVNKFPELGHVGESYNLIMRAVACNMGKLVTRQGYSDLAIFSRGVPRKFSGNAQCRRRGWLMHHGTLLYSREAIHAVPYFLRPPPKQPEYRRGRSHKSFMTNILPSYQRARVIRNVRLGVAAAFGLELRHIALPRQITPFQPETKKGIG
jgi:lipoate---protein ligase